MGARRLLRAGGRYALGALVACLALPAVASANTLFVSPNTPSPPFTSCAHPAYSSIQAAVNAPGTTIRVCAGTYAEQIQIERPVTIVSEGATVALPANTVNATTPCDKINEENSGLPNQDAISICGPNKVVIKNLTIDATWPGEPVGAGVSCAYHLFGIVASGGATLEMSGSTVKGARPQTINGCQYGGGIQIGSYWDPPATAKLVSDSVSEYQKNGITVEGSGTNATISKASVTGAGPIAAIAQNGIGVEYGAKATISSSTVTGNECENSTCGPDPLADYQSDGVYFYEGAEGSSLKASTLSGNDVGAEAYGPTVDGPTISTDKFTGDRYESVSIGEGRATITSDTMSGGNVGISLLQFEGQEYPIAGTGLHDTITGMSQWAVFGRSDKAAGDKAGEFSITASKISGNPGVRPLESVFSENPTSLKIFAEKDT
jgi:hypothetical protein